MLCRMQIPRTIEPNQLFTASVKAATIAYYAIAAGFAAMVTYLRWWTYDS